MESHTELHTESHIMEFHMELHIILLGHCKRLVGDVILRSAITFN